MGLMLTQGDTTICTLSLHENQYGIINEIMSSLQ